MSNVEQTLSIIKPDAVERNLENEIKQIFKENGFKIIKEKKFKLKKLRQKIFIKFMRPNLFIMICTYLSSGPILVMVLEKSNAVIANRDLMGTTNPKDAKDGTIRKKYGISIDKNSVHGSDSIENAKVEIDFFLKIKDFFNSFWIKNMFFFRESFGKSLRSFFFY